MKNWKHIESNLVYYWFEHHFFLLTSTFSFFFLQLKIGILIAQPQFLIHDAQKGHGLLISSDYEAHWTWSWLFLESFQQFFAWNYCLCARGGVIMQTLAVHFCQVKPSITNTYYDVLKGIYWNAIV